MKIIIRRHGEIEVRKDKGSRLLEDWKKSATDPSMRDQIVSIDDVNGARWTGRFSSITDIIDEAPKASSRASFVPPVDHEAEYAKSMDEWKKYSIEKKAEVGLAMFDIHYMSHNAFSKPPEEIRKKAFQALKDWYKMKPSRHFVPASYFKERRLLGGGEKAGLGEKMKVK